MQLVAPVRRSAFTARLKNLLKLGLLPHIEGGRGKAVHYTPLDVALMGIALEMAQLGLTPARSVLVVRYNIWFITQALQMVRPPDRPDDTFDFPMMLSFDPRALNDLSDDEEDRADATFHYAGMGQLVENLQHWLGGGISRLSIINLSALVWRIVFFTDRHRAESFYRDLGAGALKAQLADEESAEENDADDPQA